MKIKKLYENFNYKDKSKNVNFDNIILEYIKNKGNYSIIWKSYKENDYKELLNLSETEYLTFFIELEKDTKICNNIFRYENGNIINGFKIKDTEIEKLQDIKNFNL